MTGAVSRNKNNFSEMDSTADINSQLMTFELTETQWKKLKKNMANPTEKINLQRKNSERRLVMSSRMCSRSRLRGMNMILTNANSSINEQKNLIDKKFNIESVKAKENKIAERMVWSSKQLTKSIIFEELSPCDEISINTPNETKKPVNFLNKENSNIRPFHNNPPSMSVVRCNFGLYKYFKKGNLGNIYIFLDCELRKENSKLTVSLKKGRRINARIINKVKV